MTRIAKLYEHVRTHPRATLAFRDFIRLVEALGFVLVRQNGSHRCYEQPRCPDLLVIQPRGADAKPYQVQQFLDIVRTVAGLRMTPHYHIDVFWSDDDDCWIANVPDLRYCSAHGETPAEAVSEAQVAISLWLDVAKDRGITIPDPAYRSAVSQAA